MLIYSVLTKPPAQHPWAKYYSARGVDRPPMAELPSRAQARAHVRKAAAAAKVPKAPEMSAELAAAVAAVTTHVAVPGSTAAPFITAMQKEAVARELKRRAKVRHAKQVLVAIAAFVVLQFALARLVFNVPSEAALREHVANLPEDLLPFYSSLRQPLQTDGVVIAQSDQIDSNHYRFVASITLRLRKPLYVAAATNGTVQYRRLQDALISAREQDLRFNLFSQADALETPVLPLLLQQSHQAGEAIVVRVPFTARRFGWQWRLDPVQIGLRSVNRALEGDSLDRYDDIPYLIYGVPSTLGDIRLRTKQANQYVLEVTKAIQRRANVQAVADVVAAKPAVTESSEATDEADADEDQNGSPAAKRPAFDPDAPAVVQPALDPNAPAKVQPAFDPNAPAIVVPGSGKLSVNLPRSSTR